MREAASDGAHSGPVVRAASSVRRTRPAEEAPADAIRFRDRWREADSARNPPQTRLPPGGSPLAPSASYRAMALSAGPAGARGAASRRPRPRGNRWCGTGTLRDLLTALAGAVILVLVAALAVPPFVDWQAHRALVDRALAQSLERPGPDRRTDRGAAPAVAAAARRPPASRDRSGPADPRRPLRQGRGRPRAAPEGRVPLHRDPDRPGRDQAPACRPGRPEAAGRISATPCAGATSPSRPCTSSNSSSPPRCRPPGRTDQLYVAGPDPAGAGPGRALAGSRGRAAASRSGSSAARRGRTAGSP